MTRLDTCQAVVITRGHGPGDAPGNRCCLPVARVRELGAHNLNRVAPSGHQAASARLCWVHAAALDNPNRTKPLDLHKSAIGVE